MGAATAAILVVGLGAGWLVDSLANTTPIFLMIGLALGIVGAGSFIAMKFRSYLSTAPTPNTDTDSSSKDPTNP
jgi:F0F1-type ATP synthase assembly protein I